ncbi:MAG: PAS domain-containing protein [Sandaracinus sp.]|nr:PAS domain-containing protein [Sandaracinus sp.]
MEPGSEREVLTLALGIAIAVVSVVKRHVFRGLPRARRLGIAGASMLVAWTATVLEHLVFFEVLDTVEHLAYFGAALALTSWIVSVPRGFARASRTGMNEALQIAASLVLLVGLVLTPRARTLSVPARVAVAVLFRALFVQQVLDVLERHRVAWADPVGDAIAGAVPFLWGGLLLLMVDRFHTRRLSAQRAQTDSLIDELPAAVAVLDAGARVVRTSAGWRQLFPSAPLDVPLSESVGPLPEALAAALRRTLADELRGAGDAERVPGEDRWWSWVVSSWQDADASGAIVMIQDVTSRVHRETDRESTQRLAIVGELAAGVAHDMNNLLTVRSCTSSRCGGARGAPTKRRFVPWRRRYSSPAR